MKLKILYILLAMFALSCKKAKVIAPSESKPLHSNEGKSTGVFAKSNAPDIGEVALPSITQDGIHHIEVVEILPTDKYLYLNVLEGGEQFWIATAKQDVNIGSKYFFRDGLLKTNFESKEYNRVFDTIYLVSKLVAEDHAQGGQVIINTPIKNQQIKGSISIKKLVEDAASLEGKEVQVSGQCSKLNANIMGRNWIHLKDGTMDAYDLVITSDQAVPEGHTVTLKGTLVLNKDFGAGYRYNILIENAKIVHE